MLCQIVLRCKTGIYIDNLCAVLKGTKTLRLTLLGEKNTLQNVDVAYLTNPVFKSLFWSNWISSDPPPKTLIKNKLTEKKHPCNKQTKNTQIPPTRNP